MSVTSAAGGMSTSEFSIITNSQAETSLRGGAVRSEGYLQALASMYKKHSTATDLQMRVQPVQQTGTGMGTLIIPGWIRERAAEVLFEGDVDESSLAETVLNSLLKIPVDLRKTLASSILVSGGTAMLPGFIPRLHSEIIKSLSPPQPSVSRPPFHASSSTSSAFDPSTSTSNEPSSSDASPSPSKPSKARRRANRARPTPPPYDKYACLRPLIPYIAILNNPSPPAAQSERARANQGKAPSFTPAMLAWVGGSLAGALKTGGSEVIRENWDELEDNPEADESMDVARGSDAMDISELTGPNTTTSSPLRKGNLLPDWTRSPLRPGAPNVPRAVRPLAPLVGLMGDEPGRGEGTAMDDDE
ncbi:hypothetical protein NMY22_g11755 [Coprinellus aureogranulatus]|nr:hypothetical protein NMY22_g11755 [Coprinellus aureogranulatus]